MAHLETMGFVYAYIFSFILISTNKLQQPEIPKVVRKNMSILDFFQKKTPIKEESKTPIEVPHKDFFTVPASSLPNATPVSLLSN
jgi:hypothetical protein